MKRFNSVQVCPVRSLEIGDLIAKEFLGTVVSGKVTGVAFASWQLNDEQRAYMEKHGLTIPENEYEPLGGHNSYLIFGNFRSDGLNRDQPDHMYVDFDVNVAVFPQKE